MASIETLTDKLKLSFFEKDGNEFEKFVVSAYKISYPELMAVKPQGSKGDGANDGYMSGELLLQVYAPEKIEADTAIKKMNHDFDRAKSYGWSFKEWHFVLNDKLKNLPTDIHLAIDQLKTDNPDYIIKLIDGQTFQNKILGLLNHNRLMVYILLNADKDISEFGDFEKVEKVIDAISQESGIRNIKATEYLNFSKEVFLPDGIKKLEINIDEENNPELFKFFGSHIEKSQEVMEEFIPQIGLDLFTSIGNYIQQDYKKYERIMKPEQALIKTCEAIYSKLENDKNLETALWVVMAYFFDICDIGKIE
ncbi:hypothetical protein [Sulfuricurvum sp.]|uniref:hypothetical protein n=1 Tax=Sulfuricurvum sp. TaxID=2025608 RepID=UPI00262F540A|nr:hypothetical protein [Sulfuricurvum sp.]MDD2265851.1 hypothetical protein [Sulfuricurvum sp.]MDD2784607.1 hypothetical protein [Sulfuricurvum sp.]